MQYSNLHFAVNSTAVNDSSQLLHKHGAGNRRPTARRLDQLQQVNYLMIDVVRQRRRGTLTGIGRDLTQNVTRLASARDIAQPLYNTH